MTDLAPRSIPQLGASGLRIWRINAVFVFVIALIATHWPNLVLSPSAPSDKFLHAVTFGVMTFLLWRTRWIGSVLVLLVTMTVYATIDESTQSLPWIQRHTSLEDWYADVVGILVACFLISQQSSAKGKARLSLMRAALTDAAEREMFCRPFTWIAMATSAALGVLVGVSTTMAVGKLLLHDNHPWQSAFLGGVFFAAVAIYLTWRSALRAAVLRMSRARMCFRCGQNIPNEGTALAGNCGRCGEKWRYAQWVPIAQVRRGAEFSSRRSRAVLTLRGAIGIISVLFFSAVLTYVGNQWLTTDISDLCSYAIIIVGIALIARIMTVPYRQFLAKEGSKCIACGHDLQGTSTSREVGICPECATEFVRITE